MKQVTGDAGKENKRIGCITYFKKMIVLMMGNLVVYFGFCLAIKAAVGLGAWDAMSLAVSNMTGIKVGTVSILFNSACILGQLLMERQNFKLIELLQFFNVFLGGIVLNFFIYILFANVYIASYPLRILTSIVGYIIGALGVMIIMETQFVRTPLEGFCHILADRYGKPLGRLRQTADISFIIIIVILTFLFKTELTIREGTIICMLIFGPVLDLFKNPLRKVMDRLSV